MSKGPVASGPAAAGPANAASALQAQPEKPQHYTYVARAPPPPPARQHAPDVSVRHAPSPAHRLAPHRLRPAPGGGGGGRRGDRAGSEGRGERIPLFSRPPPPPRPACTGARRDGGGAVADGGGRVPSGCGGPRWDAAQLTAWGGGCHRVGAVSEGPGPVMRVVGENSALGGRPGACSLLGVCAASPGCAEVFCGR